MQTRASGSSDGIRNDCRDINETESGRLGRLVRPDQWGRISGISIEADPSTGRQLVATYSPVSQREGEVWGGGEVRTAEWKRRGRGESERGESVLSERGGLSQADFADAPGTT